jgi:hypothetical protein
MNTAIDPKMSALETRAGTKKELDETVSNAEIRVKGQSVRVPAVCIEGRTVITFGKWLKRAQVMHEELLEGATVTDPESFVMKLKKSGLKADCFTFGQRIPDGAAKHNYKLEWENAAAIAVTTYDKWWKEDAEYSIRKAVNRAKKMGVAVKQVEYCEDFVRATMPIYNETPVRQGRTFWHFGKEYEEIRCALATYLDRSIFLGAYFENELIGFMKISWVGTTGTITQILSMKKHFDKRPNNAMIAKAIEVCAADGKSHFIYGSYVYYDSNSSLTEFKRRNGFLAVPLPRYFIPLTLRGRIGLWLGLHRPVVANLPKPLYRMLFKLRKTWVEGRSKLSAGSD